ncbi:MAG TPA: ABC transporter substrate-binding protein, partial [Polyangia bacterium]|nr:ABC transporter substrate-binding protein [Polyangia bacterium]
LLSYTGSSAATSINSEHAVRLAVDRLNQAGGLGGRPIRLVVRDIQSDPNRAERLFTELVDGQVAAFIGPDSPNVFTHFVERQRKRTLFIPTVALGARDSSYGADNWFTFFPHTWTLACAFKKRLAEDGVKKPLIMHSPDSFHSELMTALKQALDAPDRVIDLPSRTGLPAAQLEELLHRDSDALLLMAFPESAAPVVSELSFRTQKGTRWYLSPTLNTPRFFEVVPAGALEGALLAKPGKPANGAFAEQFRQRWHDEPLDEAYGFYDAAAIAALALQAAMVQPGNLPTVDTLGTFVRRVAGPPGVPIMWDQLDRGLALIRAGEDIDYQGLSGQLDFDDRGNPEKTLVQWWRLGREGGIDEGPPLVTAAAWGICPGQ